MSATDWENELAELFPGYLLPEAQQSAQSPEIAARFLERLSGNPGQLRLVRIAALLHRHHVSLEDFAELELPALVRALPSWTEVERREWEGHFRGRLDVKATMSWELRGNPQRFVTRSHRRRFDRPENVLVRTVAHKLLELVTELLSEGGFDSEARGWVGRLRGVAEALRYLLLGTVLREVPPGPLDDHHLFAAQMAPQPAYATAAAWVSWFADELDEPDPARIAQLVASAALLPVSQDTRFELAVLLRITRALESMLTSQAPGQWCIQQSCVLPSREDIVRFVRTSDGAEVRLYYNQTVMNAGGPRAAALRHYFGHQGRPRPDVILELRREKQVERMVVIEVKRTESPAYAIQGFDEAWVYRWEYKQWLTAWPRAILVTTCPVAGLPRSEDDVVVVSWSQWVPSRVLEGILSGMLNKVQPS